MSQSEHIFFDVDLTADAAAGRIADSLGLEYVPVPPGDPGDTSVWASALHGVPGRIGGTITINYLINPDDPEDPEDQGVMSQCRLLWKIWRVRQPGEDYELQQQQAEQLFEALVERLSWPAVLLQGLDLLKATYDPAQGIRRFPAGTWPDLEHKHIWDTPVGEGGAALKAMFAAGSAARNA